MMRTVEATPRTDYSLSNAGPEVPLSELVRVRFTRHRVEEVFEAGDAFYVPPGHIPVVQAGTEVIQFSPSEELKKTEEVMQRNMQAMQGG